MKDAFSTSELLELSTHATCQCHTNFLPRRYTINKA